MGGRAEGPRGPLLLVAGGNGPCKIVVSPRTVKERKVVIADPNDIHEYMNTCIIKILCFD